MLTAKVNVSLKTGVVDPQAGAIKSALINLGFKDVQSVSVSKLIEIKLDSDSKGKARKDAEEMCEKLLANTVIENYKIEITED
ncbi:MAG TPA: phosphoribosylformylglycinamidine synthase subunit PurS [Thermoanaerobacterales bacterium]|jgi:phosphoribosylformylglycinamidine synthase PurS subunit|nr:phosphoribosylformylglycinamidine synthase subunit PurS [Thermoanaerobacterales bacterium]